MKKIILSLSFLTCIGLGDMHAQCIGGTLQGALVPTTSWQTIATKVGKYFNFAATAGNVYVFSFCSCDGGSITVAAELSLDSAGMTQNVIGNYNNTNVNYGFCAGANNSPQITFRCFATGTYQILIAASGCLYSPQTACTLAYIMYTPSLCYTVASMAHAPDPYTAGTVPSGAGVDDDICKTIPIGFSFCFNGTFYDSCNITTNQNLIFVGANGCSYYSEAMTNGFPSASYTTYPLPFTNSTYTAFSVAPGIGFPWQDTYNPAGGTIKYKVYGVAPNRHLTVAYNAVPLFLCNNLHSTVQVQIFETTNIIQIQTDSVPYCASWGPGGQAVMGLSDITGFAAVVPPNRNMFPTSPHWRAGQEAWKFTPSCCPVLPIRLMNFKCESGAKGIEITWATATETNNRFFIVERSADGNNFSPIKTIPGAGNSEENRYYAYLDSVPLNGPNYYRLSQMDLDGISHSFDVTSCNFNGGSVPGSIYPNPAHGSFTLTLGASSYGQTVKIYDMLGRVVFTQVFPANTQATENTINVNVNPGVYFLNIANDDQSPIIRRLVVR